MTRADVPRLPAYVRVAVDVILLQDYKAASSFGAALDRLAPEWSETSEKLGIGDTFPKMTINLVDAEHWTYRTVSTPSIEFPCFIAVTGDHIVAGSWSASRQ